MEPINQLNQFVALFQTEKLVHGVKVIYTHDTEFVPGISLLDTCIVIASKPLY